MSTEAATSVEPEGGFHLGEWLVEPSLNRVSAGGRTVQVEPRTMDVLAYLAVRAGCVVAREEILEAVWQRQFVADATLSHVIAELRRLLGDSAQHPRYIETISKRGYRVVATVRRVGAAEPVAPAEVIAEAPASGVPSVAVLPFADMSAGHDQEYFCDGVAEELTNALAHLDGLKVAARTSAFAFKGRSEDVRDIGRRLGVGAVLEGSVRKVGERLRVTVQLIDVADGMHLWSERFDRGNEDIFAIQDEIALGVVRHLRVQLLAGEPERLGRFGTTSREAYDHYLRGRHFLNRRRPGELQAAVAHLERAIALDPRYAEPHAAVAETFGIMGLWGFVPATTGLARARAAAERAVQLDDTLAEAHAWLGILLYYTEWDWERGNRHFERALALPRPSWTSGFGFGIHHLAMGRRQQVDEAARHLVAAEPLSAIAHTQAAGLCVGIEAFEGAIALLDRALELDPDLPMASFWLGCSHGVLGRVDAAAELLRRSLAAGMLASVLALPAVLVRGGHEVAAREVVAVAERLAGERYVSPFASALAWAALGEHDRAMALLLEAERERSPLLTMSLIGPGYLRLAPAWVAEWVAALRARAGLDALRLEVAGGHP